LIVLQALSCAQLMPDVRRSVGKRDLTDPFSVSFCGWSKQQRIARITKRFCTRFGARFFPNQLHVGKHIDASFNPASYI
jgi:hypothetical protein